MGSSDTEMRACGSCPLSRLTIADRLNAVRQGLACDEHEQVLCLETALRSRIGIGEALAHAVDAIFNRTSEAPVRMSILFGALGTYLGISSVMAMRWHDGSVRELSVWREFPDGAWEVEDGNAVTLDLSMFPEAGPKLAAGEALIVSDTRATDAVAERSFLECFGARSGVLVPVHYKGRLRTVFGVLASEPRTSWSDNELTLIRAIAFQLSGAMQRRSALLEIERSRAFFSQLAAGSADGLWLTDGDGATVLINERAARLLGVDQAAAIGLRATDFAGLSAESASRLHFAVRTDKQQRMLVECADVTGARRLEVTLIPLSDESGSFDGSIGIVVDRDARDAEEGREAFQSRLRAAAAEVAELEVPTHGRGRFLRAVCRALTRPGGFSGAWVGRFELEDELLSVLAASGDQPEHVAAAVKLLEDDTEVRAGLARAARGSEAAVAGELRSRRTAVANPASRFGIGSAVVVPLRHEGDETDFLMLFHSSDVPPHAAETQILTGLGREVGAVLSLIEERERHEETALRHETLSRLHYRLIEASPTAVVSIDAERRVTSFNRAAEKISGLRGDDVLGRRAGELVSGGARAAIQVAIERVLNGEEFTDEEMPLRFLGGRRAFVRTSAAPLHDAEGRISGCMFLVVDITEERRLSRADRRNDRRIRSLTAEMAMALDRERRDIAVGLHDTVGQNLAALSVMLGRLNADCARDPAVAARLEDIQGLLKQTISTARAFTFELSPPILNELGLAAALEWLVERYDGQRPGSWRFEGESVELDGERAGMLYRAGRELLQNVSRHSGAENVTVRLVIRDGDVVVAVADDGCGMNVETVRRSTNSLGLFSINEQAARFSGRLDLYARPGLGTLAEVCMPLPARTLD